MKILFWSSFFIIFYTYIGFPITLLALSLFKKQAPLPSMEYYPAVSMIIPAYNEEKTISEKLKNSLSLEYPKDRLKVIVISDGSTDKTEEIVKGYKNEFLRFVSNSRHSGKLAAMMESLKHADGEILVFTDADTILEKEALKNIVRPFQEESVGAASGNLQYNISGDSLKGRNFYWKIEQIIRLLESRLNALCFVAGPFWAMRKGLFPEALPLYAMDDVVIPMHIVRRGYRVIIEKDARGMTLPQPSPEADLASLTRTVNMGFQAIVYHKVLLNFFKYPLTSFSLIWHKIMRWLSFPLLLTIFLLNSRLLAINLYRYLFIYQVMFYALAIIGFIIPRSRKAAIFQLPFYLCLNWLGSFLGFWQGLFNSKKIILWQPAR